MVVLHLSMQEKNTFLSVLTASVMCLYFSMQEEDILEHTNDTWHSYIQEHIPLTYQNVKHMQIVINMLDGIFFLYTRTQNYHLTHINIVALHTRTYICFT